MRAIVEIGTGNGALSLIFGLWGILLGIPVITVDIEDPFDDTLRLFAHLGIHFNRADCFSDTVTKAVEAFPHPQYLLCDGGDKPRELAVFSRLLKPGSLISAHDWGMEIFSEDVEGLPLEPFMEELWTLNGVQLATWRVT
jgi:predicted O-methyltransferase YrrM